MTGVRLQPLDTWFFRAGTPFTVGDSPQEDVRSLFPPYPSTVIGALRAALARSRGWNGRGGWSREISGVLGDGPDDLGLLSVDGPFLLRNDEPLFPAPRHLLGTGGAEEWRPSALLCPGDPVVCDLGNGIRLPDTPVRTLGDAQETGRTGEHEWLTPAGMNAVLRGKLPSLKHVVPHKRLWNEEPRVGLERNPITRTAQEGLLYSTQHVRLRDGVSLGARILGLPRGWRLPFGRILTFGGESRMAECCEWKGGLSLDLCLPSAMDSGRVTVIALSPLDIADDICLGRRPIDDLGGATVVSACLDRRLRIGGWDTLARRPLPLRSVLPPGSVLFCEGAEPEGLRGAMRTADGLARIGARLAVGFGLVALGTWPRDEEVSE